MTNNLNTLMSNAPFGLVVFEYVNSLRVIYVNNRIIEYTNISEYDCLNTDKLCSFFLEYTNDIKRILNENINKSFIKYISQFHASFEISMYKESDMRVACMIKENTQSFLYQHALYSTAPSFNEIYYINLKDNYYKMVYPFNVLEDGSFSKLVDKIMSKKIHKDFIEEIKYFLSITGIKSFLKLSKTTEIKFKALNNENKYEWFNAQYTIVDITNDEIDSFTLSIKSIDKIQRQELKKQKALEEALREAKGANIAKTTFLSNMSHDIRTPLNVILGMTNIAKINIDDKGRLEDALGKIESTGKHLLTLINEVLDVSKIESGKIELSNVEFSLLDLMSDTLNIVQGIINNKNQKLFFDARNVYDEALIGDKIRIQQILINIITNASKYTPDGGKIEVIINQDKIDNKFSKYSFVIKDNGIGMSKEFIEKIYEPFSREKDSRVNKIEGTGLGLTIALSLIKLMNGAINVESEINVGTTVYIDIPLKISENAIEYNKYPNEKVLVIDSTLLKASILASELNELEVEAKYVTNHNDALSILKNEEFSLVMLDYSIADIDGIEFAQEIKDLYPNLPVVLITSYDQAILNNEAYKSGIKYSMSRPIFKSNLSSTLNKVLNTNMANTLKFNIHALIAEDNELNLEILLEFLSMLDVTCDSAKNGQEAYELYLENNSKYDLILLDVEMPILNGIETAKLIRNSDISNSNDIPIFAITANAYSSDVEKIINCGMNEHLAKPISLESLTNILLKWFN